MLGKIETYATTAGIDLGFSVKDVKVNQYFERGFIIKNILVEDQVIAKYTKDHRSVESLEIYGDVTRKMRVRSNKLSYRIEDQELRHFYVYAFSKVGNVIRKMYSKTEVQSEEILYKELATYYKKKLTSKTIGSYSDGELTVQTVTNLKDDVVTSIEGYKYNGESIVDEMKLICKSGKPKSYSQSQYNVAGLIRSELTMECDDITISKFRLKTYQFNKYDFKLEKSKVSGTLNTGDANIKYSNFEVLEDLYDALDMIYANLLDNMFAIHIVKTKVINNLVIPNSEEIVEFI